MSKKFLDLTYINAIAATRNHWSAIYMDNRKGIEGSPIYIPKRHKFKRRK